jgi:hypothetical protein
MRIQKIGLPLLAMLAVAALLFCVPKAHAAIPPVSTGTPVAVRALADGFHVVDNGSLMTLRDLQNGVWAAASSTAIYKKYYLSIDGMLGYIPSIQGANGFYAAGGRFWGGQFLYENVPAIKSLADMSQLTSGLLQYGTIGYWGTRDFQNNIWRQGWDVGLTFKFGGL